MSTQPGPDDARKIEDLGPVIPTAPPAPRAPARRPGPRRGGGRPRAPEPPPPADLEPTPQELTQAEYMLRALFGSLRGLGDDPDRPPDAPPLSRAQRWQLPDELLEQAKPAAVLVIRKRSPQLEERPELLLAFVLGPWIITNLMEELRELTARRAAAAARGGPRRDLRPARQREDDAGPGTFTPGLPGPDS